MDFSDTTKTAFAGNNYSSTDLRVQGEAFQWFRDQLATLQDHVAFWAAHRSPGMPQPKSPAPRD